MDTSARFFAIRLFMGLAVAWSSSFVSGQLCLVPKAEVKQQIIDYSGRRFHVDSSLISIEGIDRVGTSCFFAIHLKASNPTRNLTLFLSPDEQFLTPDLYDMHLDPVEAERAEHNRVSSLLLATPSPRIGSIAAAITIVEFSDFQCPFCQRMATILDALMGEQKGVGDLQLVHRNLPLPMHNWAEPAALFGQCIDRFSPVLFWKYYDFLFANQQSITAGSLEAESLAFVAANEPADVARTKACSDDPTIHAELQRDIDLARTLGVNSTPTIFINGAKVVGMQTLSQLRELVEQKRADLRREKASDTRYSTLSEKPSP